MVGIGSAIAQGATIAIVIRGVDKFSGVFKKANKGIDLLTKGFTVGALAAGTMGLAIAGLGISSIKVAASFETAFAGVRKTTDLTEKEFKDLEDRFKEITKTTPVAFEQLSAIGEIAGQLGVEGVDNLEKFTKTIADIAVTTNLTAEDAATSFARIANVMQEPLDNVDRMGAVVVDLGNNFATTEREITTFATRIAGAGKIAGLTTADIFGIGTAFTSVGIQAESGGTAVQKVLLAMTEAASGTGDNGVDFATVLGITQQQFQDLFKEDPSAAFQQFVEALGKSGDKAFNILESLEIKDQRLIRSFLSLASAGDLLKNSLDVSSNAFEENTALVEEAEKRYITFDSQMKILTNESKLLFEELGKGLIPVILELAKVFTDEVLPAIKPLIPIIGDFLVDAIKTLAPKLPKMVDNLGELVVVSLELFEALFPLLSPLIDLGGIILVGVLRIIKRLTPAIKSLSNFLAPLLELLKPIVMLIADVLRGMAIVGGGVLGSLFDFAGGVTGGIKEFFVGDAIIKPDGTIIHTDPRDTIIATRGGGMGNNFIFNIDKIQGTDPDDMIEAFQRELNKRITLG